MAISALISILASPSLPVVIPSEPSWHEHVVTQEEWNQADRDQKSVFESLFGAQANNVARFNRLDPRFARPGRKLRVPELAEGETYSPLPPALPCASGRAAYILIALDVQFLGYYENGQLVASYPVSTGMPGYGTPVGEFGVTRKCPDCKSSIYPEPTGGAPMPWALLFLYSCYWMHGGDLVGSPASHGCVRLFRADAEALFNRTEVGTTVRVVLNLADAT
jgi:lipoprotein-anchoring transpeptidase ErfK/SrfK